MLQLAICSSGTAGMSATELCLGFLQSCVQPEHLLNKMPHQTNAAIAHVLYCKRLMLSVRYISCAAKFLSIDHTRQD